MDGDDDDMMAAGSSIELSINSVVGLIALKTMKLKGVIGPNEVIVLIDCRASQNFIIVESSSNWVFHYLVLWGYGVIMRMGLNVKGE